MKHKRHIFTFVVISVLIALLFLAGCKTKSAELKALESVVSAIQLDTGIEVSRSDRDKKEG